MNTWNTSFKSILLREIGWSMHATFQKNSSTMFIKTICRKKKYNARWSARLNIPIAKYSLARIMNYRLVPDFDTAKKSCHYNCSLINIKLLKHAWTANIKQAKQLFPKIWKSLPRKYVDTHWKALNLTSARKIQGNAKVLLASWLLLKFTEMLVVSSNYQVHAYVYQCSR